MKKMFLLGVMLAVGSSVCAMKKALEPGEVYKAFKKRLGQDGKAFLFDKDEEGEEAFKKKSQLWKDDQLDEAYIKKIIDEISDKDVTWDTLLDNTSYVRSSLIAMMYFTFRKSSDRETIEKNRKVLLRLAEILEICIDRFKILNSPNKDINDRFTDKSKRNWLDIVVCVPQQIPILFKHIELVRKFYK